MTTTRPPSTDDVGALLGPIHEQPLPENVLPLIESYDELIGDRDRFLWKWAYHLFPKFTLSCVDPRAVTETREAKLTGLIFVSVLDDVAENRRDATTFEEAAKIPFDHRTPDPGRPGVDREVIEFAEEVWSQFSPTVEGSPRAEEFEEIVAFDLHQMINAMRYSCVANRNLEFVTESEIWTYDAHNMMLYGFADIDLLYSPTFDRSETSTLRRVVDHAQRMARIGNWITTWERELAEGDFTSGVVVHALEAGIVSVEELTALREEPDPGALRELVERIEAHAVEDVFLTRWHRELAAAREFEGAIDSVDVASYLDGIETVMAYHLASRGRK